MKNSTHHLPGIPSTNAPSAGAPFVKERVRIDQRFWSVGLILAFGLLVWVATLFAGAENKAPVEGVPAGSILAFAGAVDQSSAPDGWLLCDGRELPASGYEKLFRAIGHSWGQGEREGTFRIPDLRGLFLRGVSDTEDRDPDKGSRVPASNGGNAGNKVGSIQPDEIKRHAHLVAGLPLGGGTGEADVNQYVRLYSSKPSEDEPETFKSVTQEGGSESRPKNAYVHWIIKSR